MNEIMSLPVDKIIISYLVPSYNHEKYLPELLNSIEQDIRTLTVTTEVVILDDGSIDNSFPIIEEWTKNNNERFKITYLFQENRGISAVFNSLIAQSSGQFIRICASDDVIIKGSTQLLLNEFTNNPELLCAVGDGKVIDENSTIIHNSSIEYHGASPKRLADKKYLVKELIQRWCIAGPSILVRRSHYDTVQYDESSKIEDFHLFLSLLKIPKSVSYILDPVCLYRIHQTNTSKTNDRKRRIINIKCFLKIIEQHINSAGLTRYLLPLKYKTKAKILYLERKYVGCGLSLFAYLCTLPLSFQ